jgi:hypothetical protein
MMLPSPHLVRGAKAKSKFNSLGVPADAFACPESQESPS